MFMERYQEIERSIIKKFRKDIWRRFVKAVQEYNLIQENDVIMVCISGGKDSFLLAKCMEELKRHSKISFTLHYVVMNPGYTEEHQKQILENAKLLHLPITMFESDIFEVSLKLSPKRPCYMCARMRRGCLYNKAKELGCNKIALGHHFDDVIETTLLSMFYGAEIKTMLPKLPSKNFEGMELIRPLYLVKEDAIRSWVKANQLQFLNCACKFTEENASLLDENLSKRQEMKQLIQTMKKVNPHVDDNVFKAMDNVNIDCVLGIKEKGGYVSFQERTQEEQEECVSE